MNSNLAHESSVAFGRWNPALSALLAVLSGAAVFAIDGRAFSLTGMLFGNLWWSIPYLAIVLLVAIGATRGAAWISAVLAGVILVAALAAILISESGAVEMVALVGLVFGVPLALGVTAHITLLLSGISILRGGSGGGRSLATILSLSLLAVVAFVLANLQRS